MKDHTMSAMQHYGHLPVMLLASFMAMFGLMYAMTNRFDDVFMNWNQVYMAGLMAAPMRFIEIVVMRGMYKDQKMNFIVAVASAVVLLGAWLAIRQQAAITDTQFLRSMIPHHSSAILMCERASITNQQIEDLCGASVKGQQAEIDQMVALLRQLQADR